jgi:DNA invertase Pin-like site-specific DNA recombinase
LGDTGAFLLTSSPSLPDSALVVARKKSKPKKSDPPKMGRPTVLNNEEVFKLAKYGHSVQEIADVFGAHRDTIYKNYFDKYTEGRARLQEGSAACPIQTGRTGRL